MKTKSSILRSLLILSFFVLPLSLFAQNDIGDLFKSGPEDATKLMSAYVNPLFKGLGVGLNSGWTNTAKTKGPLKFDLRITATAAFVPRADRSYDVNTLGLKDIRPVNKFESTGPTAFGNNKEGAEMEFYSNGISSGNFRLPKGSGLNFVPSPQVQLTVGILNNVDVSFRYVPKIKLGDDAGNLNLFGVGAKLELIPLLMGKKPSLSPIDIAVAVGYTKVKYGIPLDINDSGNSNQHINIELSGFSAEAIVSKKIAFFTPFASVGYNSSDATLKALGTYEFDVPVTPATPTGKKSYTDPVNISQNEVNGLKAAVGFQLQFGFFKFYTSYTASKYSYLNAGIGLGIGK